MRQVDEGVRVLSPQRLAFTIAGALAILYEEVAQRGNRLIVRGQRLEQEQLTMMKLPMRLINDSWELAMTVPRQAYDRTVAMLWHVLDIPTAADYEALSAGVARLDQALAELNRLLPKADGS